MRVGLFVTCLADVMRPSIGLSTLDLLERAGCEVIFPENQTCCGQPMANSGCSKDVEVLAKQFVKTFKEYDYIVAPSGSCVTMVKEHYEPFFQDNKNYEKIKTSIYEITEFLHDIIKVESFDSTFNYKVGVHNSCHGHRVLKLGSASELNITPFNKLKNLLSKVKGIELVDLNRDDECCGFGGTFCVTEEAISVAMGKDRIKDHMDSKVEVMTGADMSCLMHMEGIINRDKNPIKVMHISEILLGETL